MAEFSWPPVSPLDRVRVPPRHGSPVRVFEHTDFGLTLVMARRGRCAETASTARRWYGVEPPARPAAVTGTTATLVWSGPGQFIAVSPPNTGGGSIDGVREAFAGAASVSEQSGSRCLVQLSGSRVREWLAKLCPIDLHDHAFAVGMAAAFAIDRSAVNMWRSPDGPDRHAVFNILVLASFAESIWHTIAEAAGE